MPIDPWAYASKTNSEHAEQVALFMWANMALNFGLRASKDPQSYTVGGIARTYKKEFSDLVPQLKWLHAISNHGAGFGRKAEGVKAGVSDIFLPVHIPSPYHATMTAFHGLYVELKRRDTENQKAGKPSAEQLEFQTDMWQSGYACQVCYGWEQARDTILSYLGLTL